VESYHQSQDACIKLILSSPQLVPTGCWNWTFHRANFAPAYPPDYDPHLNEWFVYNPPLGTVYDLSPRLYHPTVVDRSDAGAYFEKLRALAPYDCRIVNVILEKKYNNHATYDQVVELYSKVLPYSVDALTMAADTVQDKPAQYERLMTQAGELNPACYYQLAEYFSAKDEDKAEQYRDKACDNDPDRVRAANCAAPRVRYYLAKGNTEKARAIADDAADAYSYRGLEAEGVFQELTGNYDAAFEWYSKIEERYDDSTALVDFCARYRAKTGSTRFDATIQARSKKLFPQGMETVALKDFHDSPTDGVVFKEQSDPMTAAGLKEGDVIVAVYGTRVHNTAQYEYGRGMRGVPELDLIVWQGDGYREIKASPPNHLFGVDIGDYTPK
jgi:tetratricopeptide (TPR) repeat protein